MLFILLVSKGVGIKNKLFLLSNTIFNSIKAQATCSLINAELAHLDSKQVKNTLLPIFEDLYLKGNASLFD